MDSYDDEDYLDSSGPKTQKQMPKGQGSTVADLDRMMKAANEGLSDDSDLDDSEEADEYDDRDFERTPEAVDQVSPYRSPVKTQTQQPVKQVFTKEPQPKSIPSQMMSNPQVS